MLNMLLVLKKLQKDWGSKSVEFLLNYSLSVCVPVCLSVYSSLDCSD